MTSFIPQQGRPSDELLAELSERKKGDTDWRGGKVFSLVYCMPGEQGDRHSELMSRAYSLYAPTNLLNPLAFGSLKKMESELVEMVGRLFNCAGAVGTCTSGGTESILCAVASYRDRARRTRPWIFRPEIIAPSTVHPAFDKAAHLFGVKLVKVPVTDELRADTAAMEKRISRNTIALVGSAPQYPHGAIDPIAELGKIAQRHKLPLHVDACIGGFMLPWLEKLGYPIGAWDFRVPGVTSISADLHKFAYAGKGASLLLWRSIEGLRDQIFVAADFPGGIYASPTLLGTRPGGPIAAAWTALNSLGERGYLDLAKTAMNAAQDFRRGIAKIPGLTLLGPGDATIVAFTKTEIAGAQKWPSFIRGVVAPPGAIYAIADRMEARGWTVDRMHRPAAIHLTVTANHAPIVEQYLEDLAASCAEVDRDPKLAKGGSAPMYGMAATLPARGLVASRVRKVIADMYTRRTP